MSIVLSPDDFIQRVRLHQQRQSEWQSEKRALQRELSVLIGRKAAMDLCKLELQERICSIQLSLGLPPDVAVPSTLCLTTTLGPKPAEFPPIPEESPLSDEPAPPLPAPLSDLQPEPPRSPNTRQSSGKRLARAGGAERVSWD
jgi:hypothetical protein